MPSIVIDSIFIGGPNDDEDDFENNWKTVEIPAIYEVCPSCRSCRRNARRPG